MTKRKTARLAKRLTRFGLLVGPKSPTLSQKIEKKQGQGTALRLAFAGLTGLDPVRLDARILTLLLRR